MNASSSGLISVTSYLLGKGPALTRPSWEPASTGSSRKPAEASFHACCRASRPRQREMILPRAPPGLAAGRVWIYDRPMIDPAFVRDHLDIVRQKLAQRGAPHGRGAGRAGGARRRAQDAHSRGRGAEAAAERDGRGSGAGQEGRPGRVAPVRRQQGARPGDQAAGGEAGGARAAAPEDPADDSQPAARDRARGRERRRQRRGAPLGHAARVRLHAEGALGHRAGPGHPRLRARGADVGRALLGADGRRARG